VFACGATALADGTVSPVPSVKAPQVVRDIWPENRIEYVEWDGPIRTIYNDESSRIGETAEGNAEAYVFKSGDSSPYGIFLNYFPNTSPAPFTLGTMMADEAILGNGFNIDTDFITGFEVMVYRSAHDPTNGKTGATYYVELWDGDPMEKVETPSKAIIGAATFTSVPGPGVYILKADIPKTQVNDDLMWIVLYGDDTCRTGWRISFEVAQIGAIFEGDFDFTEAQSDYDAQFTTDTGYCCGGKDPMTPGMPCSYFANPCPWQDWQCIEELNTTPPCYDTGGRGFCMDGFAESQWNFWFGGPCDGGVGDSCASFVGAIYSQTDFVARLTPVQDDGGGSYVGNEVKFAKGGAHVWLEGTFEGWGPYEVPQARPGVKTWQQKINSAGFYSGLAGTLTPWNAPCTTDADCQDAHGHGLSGLCNAADYPPGGCTPAFGDYTGDASCPPNDFTPGDACLQLDLPACTVATLDFVCGSTIIFSPPAQDDTTAHYAMTLVLEVSAGAVGTFTVPFNVKGTWMKDDANALIRMVGHAPALITVETGQCCDFDTEPDPTCISDTMTANQCADAGGETFDPDKDCDDPCACENDAQCDDGDACTDDSCDTDTGQCVNEENFDSSTECCVVATGVTCTLDDGNQCTQDDCSEANSRGTCINDAAAMNGEDCDDGQPCATVNDTCTDGDCIGTPIVQIPCNDDQTCSDLTQGLGTCNLVNKVCRCVPPSLTPVVRPGDKPNALCFAKGEKVFVDITFADVPVVVEGGQFTLFYDPDCLEFQDIVPVWPYEIELITPRVDEVAGEIFYAVGALLDPGMLGEGILATVSFTKASGCTNCKLLFGGENPDTALSSGGQPVEDVELKESAEIHENDKLSLVVPDSEKVNVDCSTRTALVTWDAPMASSSCGDPDCDPQQDKCYEVNLLCSGVDPNQNPIAQDTVMNGGVLNVGMSTFSCTATSKICGDSLTIGWTVIVNETTDFDVEVQLEPIMVGDVTRCITFMLYEDCVQPPDVIQKELVFGGKADFVGHYTDAFKIPTSGQWACITAEDQQHSLRSVAYPECGADGTVYAAFKGDPDYFGGNWLTQGNLDGWKKTHGQYIIDIYDFGQFVSMYLQPFVPDTLCADKHTPHGDINGDGIVDGADFAFIVRNFLEQAKDSCCPDGGTAVAGRTEVSVRELREMGLRDLVVADLNGDGLVNMDDMTAFMEGQRPRATKVPDRSSTLRGSK
jgi:hypothetical protein